MRKIKEFVIVIIVFVMLFCSNHLKAQNKGYEQEILEKYWYYRSRLKKQFIVISPDNELGTNIPACIRHRYGVNPSEGQRLEWGDTEAHLGFYIAVLATEYRLLKDYGQDYNETLNELYWAMLAVDRIDYLAETNWSGGYANLNGFFIRSDAKGCNIDPGPTHPEKNCDECILNIRKDALTYKNTLLEDDGTGQAQITLASGEWKSEDCSITDPPLEESQDQCWHLLYGLSFVKKMMEGESETFLNMSGQYLTIEEWAKKSAFRIINYMHNCEELVTINGELVCLKHGWFIRNPVTHEKVNGPGTCYFPGPLSYGFAEAANWITSEDYGSLHYRYSNSPLAKSAFIIDLWGGAALNFPFDWDVDNYHSRVLTTIMGDDNLMLTETGIISTFQFLKFTARYCRTFKYPHLPLSWYILHGANSTFVEFSEEDINFYRNLLQIAPNCGPFNISNPNLPGYVEEWSSTNAFVWPESLGGGIGTCTGYYNGLDYMLLHNLYWLAFIAKYPLHNYVENSPYPLITGQGSHSNPISLFSRNIINTGTNILNTGNVTFEANHYIKMMPGFTVLNGAYFHAFLNGLNQEDHIYKKLEISDCNVLADNSSIIKNEKKEKYEMTCQQENEIINEVKKYVSIHPLSDSISSDLKNFTISIMPNPTHGKIYLLLNNPDFSEVTIELYNSSGKIILKIDNFTDDYKEIDIQNFSNGLYLLKLSTRDKIISIKKIIKN